MKDSSRRVRDLRCAWMLAGAAFATGCGGSTVATVVTGSDASATQDATTSSDAGNDAAAQSTRDSSADVAANGTCADGGASCGGACVDLTSDFDHCGACGTTCSVGQACVAGSCTTACSSGQLCGTSCKDTQNDPANCGTCDHVCTSGLVCATGQCSTTCAPGSSICGADAGASNPYCANFASDNANCGSCNNSCTSGYACVSGACKISCPSGESVCGGDASPETCANLMTDRANCGTCGHACASGYVCGAGTCAISCPSNLTTCTSDAGATCADITSDPENCGGCNAPCGSGQSCVSSHCTAVCSSGQTDCSNACVDTTSDVNNCGACANSCPNGFTCSNSACQGIIADWRFEGDVTDSSVYANDGTNKGATFTGGYAGRGLYFNGTSASVLVAQPTHLPIGTSPRTLEAWVNPTGYTTTTYNGILSYGLRTCTGYGQLLSIRSNGWVSSSNWCNDLVQNTGTTMATGQWSHVAFTYDGTKRALYLNGQRVANDAPTAAINTVDAPDLRIGSTDNVGRYFYGLIDEVRIYNYARTATQILSDASLAAYFTFDASDGIDSGPNHLNAAVSGTSLVTGHIADALGFASPDDYVTATGFTGLGTSNEAFSIALWVKVTTATGAIAHVSSTSDGNGTWCTPFLGFDANGHLTAQAWNGTSQAATYATAIATGTWVHVAETWSTGNGLRLYLNGAIVATRPDVTSYVASGAADTILFGGVRSGTGCSSAAIGTSNFVGALDDAHVYTRELTAADVTALASQ